MTPRDEEEHKNDIRVNSDIKELMTNTSAEKQSLNSSFRTDSLHETRIMATQNKKPLDLISEYRSTILQRYNQKMFEDPMSSQVDESAEKNKTMMIKQPPFEETKFEEENSLPASKIQNVTSTTVKLPRKAQKLPGTERKRHKS